MIVDYSNSLLRNVHESLPICETGETVTVRGNYEYWHYGCDGFDDRAGFWGYRSIRNKRRSKNDVRDEGWGCGYRTLQTICSWIIINKNLTQRVPNLRLIQKTLVAMEDKEKSFVGSRGWIGSFEVCLILDNFYNVPCKIVHITSGKELLKYVPVIRRHFEEFGSPIMMGGDKDCSSKYIAGINIRPKETHLLIVDPHFVGKVASVETLKNNHWVKWQSINDFVDSSFYNLCLPQIKAN